MPVKMSNGIADKKQQSVLYTQVTYQYPNWLFGALHGDNRENVKAHTKGTTGNTMMQEFTSLGSLLGMPGKMSNGIADKKQQSNLYTQVTY